MYVKKAGVSGPHIHQRNFGISSRAFLLYTVIEVPPHFSASTDRAADNVSDPGLGHRRRTIQLELSIGWQHDPASTNLNLLWPRGHNINIRD